MSEPVTLGELERNLASMKLEMKEGFEHITAQIAALNFVSQAVYDANRQADDRRFSDLETDVKEMQERSTANWRSLVSDLLYPFLLLVAVGLVLGKEFM